MRKSGFTNTRSVIASPLRTPDGPNPETSQEEIYQP